MKNRQSNVELIIRAAVAVTGVQPFPVERRVNLAISDASFKKIWGPKIASPKFRDDSLAALGSSFRPFL